MSESSDKIFEDKFHLKEPLPDLFDYPWNKSIADWDEYLTIKMEKAPSRHPVVFLEISGDIYAIKELPEGIAETEYNILDQLNQLNLPAVEVIGYGTVGGNGWNKKDILVTRYLKYSLPYRSIFMREGLERYQSRLLDALASLLVSLHLAGFYWGDCSLSNVLFRRDAGELQAYLVDAETSKSYNSLSTGQRNHDLMIMEENVKGDLMDLQAMSKLPKNIDVFDVGSQIKKKYDNLWNKINDESLIHKQAKYRINEYISELNDLGFSVSEIELVQLEDGKHLKFRTIVTDRNYHRHLLQNLTGLIAEEVQARLIVNEIYQFRVELSQKKNRSVPLSYASHFWFVNVYDPIIEFINSLIETELTNTELFCQILENKWFLSESKGKDVGYKNTIYDYIVNKKGVKMTKSLLQNLEI